jgi:hypothetical protein
MITQVTLILIIGLRVIALATITMTCAAAK